NKEVNGRKLAFNSSKDRKASHETIGKAISNACEGLEKATSLRWFISRDSHYQMSNRFAWAWKLTESGIPIALVYLGFVKAKEMEDKGKPFADSLEWEQLVKTHSESLFPSDVWGQRWVVNGQPFIPLIRSIEQPLTFEEART
ncbi:MAG: hypothetical protein NTV49_13085, partial [Kiritimatiellaeota bacterium]|nr:hypothetical protein [Kiritimatiellota bacterium]